MTDLRRQLSASLKSPCVYPVRCIYASDPMPPAEPVCQRAICEHYARQCAEVRHCRMKIAKRVAL